VCGGLTCSSVCVCRCEVCVCRCRCELCVCACACACACVRIACACVRERPPPVPTYCARRRSLTTGPGTPRNRLVIMTRLLIISCNFHCISYAFVFCCNLQSAWKNKDRFYWYGRWCCWNNQRMYTGSIDVAGGVVGQRMLPRCLGPNTHTHTHTHTHMTHITHSYTHLVAWSPTLSRPRT
jgi:hypothetical protein